MKEPERRMADEKTPTSHRHFIERALILIALAGLTLLLVELRDILILVFGAVVIAVLLSAITDPIHRRLKIGRGFSLAIAVAIVLGVLIGAGTLFGREMASQVRDLSERLPAAWQSAGEQLENFGIELPDIGGGNSPAADPQTAAESQQQAPAEDQPGNLLSEIDPSLFGRIGGILMTIFGGIAHTLLIVAGGIYLAAQPDLYRKGLLKLFPQESRARIAQGLDDSGRSLKLWLLGTLISMVLVGSLTAFGLWLLGVPSWLALGLLAGLFEFIPIIGPIAAGIPGVLLALTLGMETALWVLGLYILIQQLEGNVIQPIVQRYAVDLPPAMLLFTLVAAGVLFGLPGIIFAAPLTVVVYVLVKRLYVQGALGTPTEMPSADED
jgi:predicted PurR-regulated permease PerM